MISQACLLFGQIPGHYKDKQLVQRQIQEELWQERLAEFNEKTICEQERKRNFLKKLAGCEVKFLTDYRNNMFVFYHICSVKRERDLIL